MKRWPDWPPSPSCFPRGKFSHFLACTGILRPVTPHRLAHCPPLGQIVIFICQSIATLPALSPPSQETHVKRMKTGRQFHPSAPPSRTPLASTFQPISWMGWRDRQQTEETGISHFHIPKAGHQWLRFSIPLCLKMTLDRVVGVVKRSLSTMPITSKVYFNCHQIPYCLVETGLFHYLTHS